jgi:hypothetical protein
MQAPYTLRGPLVTPKQQQKYAIWHMVPAKHDCYDGGDTHPRKGHTKGAHSRRSVGLHLPQAVLIVACNKNHSFAVCTSSSGGDGAIVT